MNFELDDLWLDKMEGLSNFSIPQKRRIYRILIVYVAGSSYFIDTLILILFATAGTIDSHVPLYYAIAALIHITLFSFIHWTGISERCPNPHLTVFQMTYSILVQIAGIIIAPQITQLFLGIMFIIFTFGTLRISLKQTLVVWFFTCLAIAITLSQLENANLGIISPSGFEAIIVGIAFATILLRCIGLGYYATALRMKLYEKTYSLQHAATYDELTGLLNRSNILTAINQHIDLCRRKNIVSSVVMIDIDHFKNINDTLGHVTGDAVLKRLAKEIDLSKRDTDHLGRYGGEEFIMLLTATNLEEARLMMERIRIIIADLHWHDFRENIKVTVSCGITEIHATDNQEQLIARADQALYEAKHNGRNMTCTIA